MIEKQNVKGIRQIKIIEKWNKIIRIVCVFVFLICSLLTLAANQHRWGWDISRPQIIALLAVECSCAICIAWLPDECEPRKHKYLFIVLTVLVVAVFFWTVIFGKTP